MRSDSNITRLHVVVAALVAAALSVSSASAREQRGCSTGHSAEPDAHRVYAIPGGCVRLYRRDGGYYSIGPQLRTRVNGHDDGEALPRDPIGEAEAACGFSRFLVWFPYFVVTATRVAWGDGTGCHDLAGTAEVIWSGHFVMRGREGRRPARWQPVVDFSSPPLRR